MRDQNFHVWRQFVVALVSSLLGEQKYAKKWKLGAFDAPQSVVIQWTNVLTRQLNVCDLDAKNSILHAVHVVYG